MPRLQVDLSEAQSRQALPDDTYDCKVFEISAPKKGPKSSYVQVIFEVADGEFAGRKIYDNRPVTGEGAGMFAELYSKLTGEEVDVDEMDSLDIDTDDLVGLDIGVVTKQEEYPAGSGEYTSKVSKLLRA